MSLLHQVYAPPLVQRDNTPLDNDDIDAESAVLIAKLALEDLSEMAASKKGKSRADAPLTDEEYAYQLQLDSFQEMLTLAEDYKLARSLNLALETDAAYLEAIATAEAAAVEDRCAAQMASRGEALPPPSAAQMQLENPAFVMHPDPPTPATVKGKWKMNRQIEWEEESMSDDDTVVPDTASFDEVDYDYNYNNSFLSRLSGDKGAQNSTSSTGSGSSGVSTKVSCTICGDQVHVHRALATSCNHHYCGDCVISLVDNFTRDESLYPLRCCKEPIPIAAVNDFISSNLRELFLTKHAEFSILTRDRLYCVNPTCSAFLGSSEGANNTGVVCSTCRTSTCPRCKQGAHGEEDCTGHAATVELRAMAREAGWQTCPGCHAVVELSTGCYHMTCRCRAQFCYLCALPWKTCSCTQWHEHRLVEEAQHRIENEIGVQAARRIEPEVMRRRVRARAEFIRNNHYCDRHFWRHRAGGGQCEECNHYLPEFLKICKHCSLLACVRCTRNRL